MQSLSQNEAVIIFLSVLTVLQRKKPQSDFLPSFSGER